MKRAFTMIELIFVIVIMGILSAVAIPKLAATRDDADAAKSAMNMNIFISDITSYYTAHGSLSANMTDMTNVEVGNFTNPQIFVSTVPCVDVTMGNVSSIGIIYMKFDKNTTNMNNVKCRTFYGIPTVKKTLETTVSYELGGSRVSITGGVIVGGRSAKF